MITIDKEFAKSIVYYFNEAVASLHAEAYMLKEEIPHVVTILKKKIKEEEKQEKEVKKKQTYKIVSYKVCHDLWIACQIEYWSNLDYTDAKALAEGTFKISKPATQKEICEHYADLDYEPSEGYKGIKIMKNKKCIYKKEW